MTVASDPGVVHDVSQELFPGRCEKSRKPDGNPATFSTFSLFSVFIVFWKTPHKKSLPKGGDHIFLKVDDIYAQIPLVLTNRTVWFCAAYTVGTHSES